MITQELHTTPIVTKQSRGLLLSSVTMASLGLSKGLLAGTWIEALRGTIIATS